MTQLQITAFGDPSVLRLNPSLDKVPAEGEVRVRICFAGVNPIDAKTRAGLGWAAAQNKDKLPWTPGYDVSGVVEKVGPADPAFSWRDVAQDLAATSSYPPPVASVSDTQ